MSNLMPQLVGVAKIACDIPCHLDPYALDDLAEAILEAKALAVPLIVHRSGLDSFALVAGATAYHGAMRARELDPINGEKIACYIVDDVVTDDAMMAQIKLLAA